MSDNVYAVDYCVDGEYEMRSKLLIGSCEQDFQKMLEMEHGKIVHIYHFVVQEIPRASYHGRLGS